MAQPIDHFILQFLAHCSKIGIVTRDSNEQVPVIRGIFLGILQHRRIQHVDLESGATVLDISLEEGMELAGMNNILSVPSIIVGTKRLTHIMDEQDIVDAILQGFLSSVSLEE